MPSQLRKTFVALAILTLALGCASQSPVLEEVPPQAAATPSGSAPAPEATSSTTADASQDAKANPAYQELVAQLARLGYQGVGLEYESNASLQLLKSIFSDPRAANRRVRQVYTGLNLAYDAKYSSLTIGGSADAGVILDFIDKKVPRAAAAPSGVAKKPEPAKKPSPKKADPKKPATPSGK